MLNATEGDYGPRLTQAEYEHKLVSLQAGRATNPSFEQDRKIRVFELNLMIDYRLGTNFPLDRRQELVAEHRRQSTARLWHAAKGAFTLRGPSAGLTKGVVDGFSRVLSDEDLKAFLELTDDDLQRVRGTPSAQKRRAGPR